MNKIFIYFCIIFLLPLVSLGQLNSSNCSSIKKADFYFYPSNSQKQFLIVRNNSLQKEIDINTGDTSFWKVKWLGPCIFTLSFLRRSQPISNEELLFFNSHKTIVEVLKVTPNYYVFKGGLDSIAKAGSITDTLWHKKRIL